MQDYIIKVYNKHSESLINQIFDKQSDVKMIKTFEKVQEIDFIQIPCWLMLKFYFLFIINVENLFYLYLSARFVLKNFEVGSNIIR